MGISYDRYDEESGGKHYGPRKAGVILPHDYLTAEQISALSGEMRVYKQC